MCGCVSAQAGCSIVCPGREDSTTRLFVLVWCDVCDVCSGVSESDSVTVWTVHHWLCARKVNVESCSGF